MACQNKSFISLVLEALSIKKKYKLYKLEKHYAKKGLNDGNKNICLCTKFSKYNRPGFSTSCPPKNHGLLRKFLAEESMGTYVLKSVFGFIGGVLLTYICFMFLVFSLNFTLKRATYICMGLGVVLTLGLAFSVKIRCTVFLCIPQLFSKRGRQALLAYAFILALSGPAKNTLHNVEVMSESLACGQQQIKQAENELLKFVQKPNAAARKSIEKLLEKINSAVKYFKNFIMQFYRNCFDILETVFHAQEWLYSITLLCHKKMGKPHHRCVSLLWEASNSCEPGSKWDMWKKLCKIPPESLEAVCHTNKKSFCLKSDVNLHLPARRLQKELNIFKHRAMNLLYVKVEAHQTYSQWNRTNVYHEEYQGMATEIRQKTDQFLQYFDFMSVIFGIFIFVLSVKVIIYRHKFLTEDHYDNRFITTDFEEIDAARAQFCMETLLPLEPRERLKYIKVSSIRLVPCERVRLLSSFVFLIFATFKIIIHMLTDSSLYWILSSVRRDERMLYMNNLKEIEPDVTVTIEGDGIVASLLRNVTVAVNKQSTITLLDPTPCLPDPVPPDWNRYYQILALVLICWLLALCEPYGLRLRHTVMVTYHPDRARERAIWLYNRIISNRCSFVKVARRELRRKYKDYMKNTCESLQFMKKKKPLCLLCHTKLGCSWVKCPTPSCVGIYCYSCFESLKLCSICTDPEEYGDADDFSEEKDSSDDENLDICSILKGKGKSRPENLSVKFKKEKLIQPELLISTIDFCKSKISISKKQKCPLEVESSDWEEESVEDKREFPRLEPIEEKNSEGSIETVDSKKTKSLLLFEKVPLPSAPEELLRKMSFVMEEAINEKSKPDFRFKTLQTDFDEFNMNSDLIFHAEQPNICEELHEELPEEVVEFLASEKDDSEHLQFFPFVDPDTIYQIDQTKSSETSKTQLDTKSSKSSKSTKSSKSPKSPKSSKSSFKKLPSTARSGTRICLESHSSDSSQDDVRLCLKESTETTLSSDSQFNSEELQTSSEGELALQRKPSKTDLIPPKYKVETDSSNEHFLAVKPNRKFKKRKKKRVMEESEILLAQYRAESSRNVDFLKAKLARTVKKNMEKTSAEETSDVDGGEYNHNVAVFFSEQQFQKLSERICREKADNGDSKKSKRLSWAPDLVVDFPLAKCNISGTSTD